MDQSLVVMSYFEFIVKRQQRASRMSLASSTYKKLRDLYDLMTNVCHMIIKISFGNISPTVRHSAEENSLNGTSSTSEPISFRF